MESEALKDDLLIRAGDALDEMWYARYHGGQNGRDASARWARLRAVANDIDDWRRRTRQAPSPARKKDLDAARAAARLRAARQAQEKTK